MRALRATVLCSAGVAAVSLMFVCLRAAECQPAAAKTPDLQQRVATLEEKVAQLEKKLDQISPGYLLSVPPVAAAPFGSSRVPTAPQVPSGIPPHAVPREFNGQTYYIVPLAKEAAR
jgi:hypothetical protein